MSIINPGDVPINEAQVDGTELARRLERLYAVVHSQNSSATRPPAITAGGLWSKTVTGGFDVMLFDGTADVKIGSVLNGVATISQWEDVPGGIAYTGGNVGIGTQSPTSTLSIHSTGTDHQLRVQNTGSAASDDAIILVQTGTRGATSASSGLYLGDADSQAVGRLVYRHVDDSMTLSTGSTERLRINSVGDIIVGDSTGGITAKTGFSVINPSGQSYITVAHPTGTPTSFAYAAWTFNGVSIGSVAQSGTNAVLYQTTSDYRLKDNIAPMSGALDKVKALKPVTYKWKSDGSDGQGFIAHELQAVVPECVTGSKDAMRKEIYEITPEIPAQVDAEGKTTQELTLAVKGEREVPDYQGIDTSFLVATLTAAIQELNAKVDAQAEKIAALEAK